MRRWNAWLLLSLTGGLWACEPSNFQDDRPSPACSTGTAAVAGTWELSGAGARTDCDDPLLDADDVRIRSLGLTWLQNGEDLELDPNPSFGPDFEWIDGMVEGSCVRFTTQESLGNGDRLRFRFDGELVDSDTISGTFEGTGPEGCRTEGNFEATRRR